MRRSAMKLHPRWAVIAAVALVASVMAASAPPATAVVGVADAALSHNAACTGNAMQDRGFTDVVPGSTHAEAINCLAHYGITIGTGDGTTYSPRNDVSRGEMARFMHRAATVSGVRLAIAGDQGLTDVRSVGSELQDIINSVVAAGIMRGRTATTFDLYSAMTRAEMALAMLGLLAHAVEVNPLSNAVSIDSRSHRVTVRNSAGQVIAVDDSFDDVRDTQPSKVDEAVNVLFELGVTTGVTSSRFNPDGFVSREEMASFITRALAFTSAKPAGVSITPQAVSHDSTIFTVTVLDADRQPVAGARVDAFYALGDGAADGLRDDGTCDTRIVRAVLASVCQIGGIDQRTTGHGHASVVVPALVSADRGFTVWAWTGATGDHFDADDSNYAVFVSGPDAGDVSSPSSQYTLTLDTMSATSPPTARLGETVTATLQVVDSDGRAVAEAGHRFSGTVMAVLKATDNQGNPVDTPLSNRPLSIITGADGAAQIEIGGLSDYVFDDPNRSNQPDVLVSWNIGKELRHGTSTVQPSCGSASAPVNCLAAAKGNPDRVRFSEADSTHSGVLISQNVAYARAAESGSRHFVTVTVTDQYGDPMPTQAVRLDTTDSSKALFPTNNLYTLPDGTVTITFARYSGSGERDLIHAHVYEGSQRVLESETLTMYWVISPSGSAANSYTNAPVIAGSPLAGEVVVDGTLSEPWIMSFDADDVFTDGDNLNAPVTQGEFAAQIAAHLQRLADGVNSVMYLSWKNHNPAANTVTTWRIASSR